MRFKLKTKKCKVNYKSLKFSAISVSFIDKLQTNKKQNIILDFREKVVYKLVPMVLTQQETLDYK